MNGAWVDEAENHLAHIIKGSWVDGVESRLAHTMKGAYFDYAVQTVEGLVDKEIIAKRRMQFIMDIVLISDLTATGDVLITHHGIGRGQVKELAHLAESNTEWETYRILGMTERFLDMLDPLIEDKFAQYVYNAYH